MPKKLEIAQDDAPLGVTPSRFFAPGTAPSIDIRAAALTSRQAHRGRKSSANTDIIAVQSGLVARRPDRSKARAR